jgi:hypothetical protein
MKVTLDIFTRLSAFGRIVKKLSLKQKVIFASALFVILAAGTTLTVLAQGSTPPPKAKPVAVAKVKTATTESVKAAEAPAPTPQTAATVPASTAPAAPTTPACPEGTHWVQSASQALRSGCRTEYTTIPKVPKASSISISPAQITFCQTDPSISNYANFAGVFVSAYPDQPTNWTIVDNSGLFDLQHTQLDGQAAHGTLTVTFHGVATPVGTYTILVTGTDPATGLATTKTLTVTVIE